MSWIFAVVLGVMIGATLRRRSPVPTGPSALRLQRLDARIALLMEHLELRDDAPGAADAFTRIERSVDHLLRNLGLSSADSAVTLSVGTSALGRAWRQTTRRAGMPRSSAIRTYSASSTSIRLSRSIRTA